MASDSIEEKDEPAKWSSLPHFPIPSDPHAQDKAARTYTGGYGRSTPSEFLDVISEIFIILLSYGTWVEPGDT